MKIKTASICDRGKVRLENEDAFIACVDLEQPLWTDTSTSDFDPLMESGALLVVADGVGGANAGEMASTIAIEQTKKCFSPDVVKKALEEQGVEKLMVKAIKEADNAIKEAVSKNLETMGMGTTIVMAWVVGDKVRLAWCGDSRCYLYHSRKGLQRLTKDHSYVQELIDKGELTEEDAVNHPESNIITRGLGDMDIDNEPETLTMDVAPGDMLLLCSDGLCGYCTDKAILHQLNRHCTDVDACVEALFDMAMEKGGDDNITIALMSIIDDNASRPPKRPLWKRILDTIGCA